MADSRWLMAIVLAGMILAGCMVGPALIEERGPGTPGDWILEDVAPVETFTAPARTARPTNARPTATGTIAPTPTMAAGLYLFDSKAGYGTGRECAEAIASAYPTAPWADHVTSTPSALGGVASDYDLELCNTLTYPVSLAVRQKDFASGMSTTHSTRLRCLNSTNCVPAFPTVEMDTRTNLSTCGDPVFAQKETWEETNVITVWPWAKTPTPIEVFYNVYFIDGFASGGIDYGDCGADSYAEYEITYLHEPNPSDYATPTRDATRDAWITEVLARPEGATCGDWNLRGGCGWNDQFVEVGVPSAMSLAGYRIDIEDAANAVTCSYTIASDNLTEPLKTFWQDYMDSGVTAPTATPTGTITPTTTPTATPTGTLTPVPTVTPAPDNCGPWPETGYAKLYNASGSLIDTRAYDYGGGGQYGDSWAATDWTNPGGQWWWYSPSPGMANRIPPTATPTATATP